MAEGLWLAAVSAVGGQPGEFLPPMPEELGLIFPEFEIISLIGRGGMGAVYRARERELDRTVAIKILPPEADSGGEFRERFRLEAAALAKLNHPHIVTLHRAGEREGYYYFVMEFIEGTDLAQLLLRETQLPVEQTVEIAEQLCRALEYSHQQGVVHRDIKPANILIDSNGEVKVADFGLAKILQGENNFVPDLTRTRSSMGTVHYMAPEQASGAAVVDHRADIYAIGAVIYETLTGVVPTGAFDPPSELVPKLNRSFDDIVLRSMRSEPEQRFQDVSVLREELVQAMTSRKYARRKWLRRAALATVVLTSIAVGIAGYALLNPKQPEPAATVPTPAEPTPTPSPEPPKPAFADRVSGFIERLRTPPKSTISLASLPTPTEPSTLVGFGSNLPRIDGRLSLGFALSREPGRFSASISPEGELEVWGELDVPSPLTQVKGLAAGGRHLLALHNDGTVTTLGLTAPPVTLERVVAVGAGMHSSWALHEDGKLTGWGPGAEHMPTDLPPLQAIAVGESFVMGLTRDGKVIAWGDNTNGQCDIPNSVRGKVTVIAAGKAHGLALLKNGKVIAWGKNDLGQCDPPPLRVRAVRILAGGNGSASITMDGRLNVWGEIPDSLGDPLMPIATGVLSSEAWVLLANREG